MLTIASIE
jgi:hypothetical protein